MTPHTPTARAAGRALTVAATLALSLALALLPGAAPAGAHDGGGTITVEQVHPAGLSVHYIVMLTWDNDGHAAADATITATPVGPDGASLTPTTLAPSGAGDGRYSGSVEFPSAGAWTVRFTSIDPTGSAERPEQVTEPTTTTAAPGDDGPADTGDTATTQAGVALADDGTGGSAQAPDGSNTSDDGGIPVLLIVGAAVVALGGVVTALLAIRRYRPDLESGEAAPAAGEPATDPEPDADPAPGAGVGAGAAGEPDPATGEPEPATGADEAPAPASSETKGS